MAEKEPAESGRRLHVTTLLVASRRALDNALSELGFAEDDDRIVEHDGRLAFLTCSHEEDCDDMFALISELSSRGESWELQSRIDAEPAAPSTNHLPDIARSRRSMPRSRTSRNRTPPSHRCTMSRPPKACRL